MGQLRLRGALRADLCADVISQCRVRVLLQHMHYVWIWARWEKKRRQSQSVDIRGLEEAPGVLAFSAHTLSE